MDIGHGHIHLYTHTYHPKTNEGNAYKKISPETNIGRQRPFVFKFKGQGKSGRVSLSVSV